MEQVVHRSRNIGLDLLRIVCIFTVIVIHTPHVSETSWRDILRYLPFANGCFAFMAGMFLFGRRSECGLSVWFNKRVRRLLFPYLVWTVIYVVWGFASRAIYGRDLFPSFSQWFEIVFFGAAQGQLWFIIFLFYSQVILFTTCFRFSPKYKAIVLTAITIGLMFVSPSLEFHAFKKLALLSMYGAMGGIWTILQESISKVNKNRLGLCCAGIILLAFFIRMPLSLKVISYVVLFQQLPIMGGKVASMIENLASCTMGIYFFHHMIPAYFITKILPAVTRTLKSDTLVLLLTSIFIFSCSLSVVTVARRNKILKLIFCA